MDVAALALRHPGQRERARELAVAYGVADRLDVWLKDPRLRAEAVPGRSGPASGRPSGRRVARGRDHGPIGR